jgi:hypothetical protein
VSKVNPRAISRDCIAQIDHADLLLDHFAEQVDELSKKRSAALKAYEALAYKATLSAEERAEYAKREKAVDEVDLRLSRVWAREKKVRRARQLLRSAMRIASNLKAKASLPGEQMVETYNALLAEGQKFVNLKAAHRAVRDVLRPRPDAKGWSYERFRFHLQASRHKDGDGNG